MSVIAKEYIEINLQQVPFVHGQMSGMLSFDSSQKVLLLGDNGAGKTSLIEYVKSIQDRVDAKLFFLSQNSLPQHDALATIDLLNIIKKSLPERFNQIQFDEFVELLGLHSLVEQKLSTLSGGEEQLVKLSLCYAVDADFYLLDEPFNNLSKLNREKVRGFLINNLKGFLVIDHFSDEWSSRLDKKFILRRDNRVLSLKELDHD